MSPSVPVAHSDENVFLELCPPDLTALVRIVKALVHSGAEAVEADLVHPLLQKLVQCEWILMY